MWDLTLIFFSLLFWISWLFSFPRNSLFFCAFFPFFPRILGVRRGQEILVFLVLFLAVFQKSKEKKIRVVAWCARFDSHDSRESGDLRESEIRVIQANRPETLWKYGFQLWMICANRFALLRIALATKPSTVERLLLSHQKNVLGPFSQMIPRQTH